MTREEAIEVYNGLINTKIREAFEFFAPELKESGDAEIKRLIKVAINGWFTSDGMIYEKESVEETKKKCLAWLEKQGKNKDLPSVTDMETLDEYAYQVAYDLSNDWLKDTPTWDDVETAVKLGAKWLEKQDEHKKFRDSIQVGDRVTRNEDGVLVNLSQLKRVAKPSEQKPANKVEPKFKVGDKVLIDGKVCTIKLVNEDNYIVNENGIDVQEHFSYAKDWKLVEQKPTECPEYCVMSNCANCPYHPVLIKKPTWSEEDERMITDLSVIVHTYFSEISGIPFKHDLSEDKIRTWLKFLKDRVQPKREWSEDDSVMIDNILGTYKTLEDMLDLTTSQDKDILESMNFERDWIMSLKNNPQPKQEWKQENIDDLTDFENVMMHIGNSFFGENAGLDPNDTIAIKEQATILLGLVPKQEWSEEDDEKLISAIEHLKESEHMYHGYTSNYIINWLKSLRPQNNWKPSEEQMKALKVVVGLANSMLQRTLESLYNDLKKLTK